MNARDIVSRIGSGVSVPTGPLLMILYFIPWLVLSITPGCENREGKRKEPEFVAIAQPNGWQLSVGTIGLIDREELSRRVRCEMSPENYTEGQGHFNTMVKARPWFLLGLILPVGIIAIGAMGLGRRMSARKAGAGLLIFGVCGGLLLLLAANTDYVDDFVAHEVAERAEGKADASAGDRPRGPMTDLEIKEYRWETRKQFRTEPTGLLWLSLGVYGFVAACGAANLLLPWSLAGRRTRPKGARSSPEQASSPKDRAPSGDASAEQAAALVFPCTSCKAKLRASLERAGTQGKCPKCGVVLLVPGSLQRAQAGPQHTATQAPEAPPTTGIPQTTATGVRWRVWAACWIAILSFGLLMAVILGREQSPKVPVADRLAKSSGSSDRGGKSESAKKSRTAAATRKYWLAIAQLLADKGSESKLTSKMASCATDQERSQVLAKGAEELRNTAWRISSMPARDVDSELIALSNDLTGVLVKQAGVFDELSRILADRHRVNEYYSSQEAFAEALARGLLGDSFGTARDLVEAQRLLQNRADRARSKLEGTSEKAQDCLSRLLQLRSKLSQKYGVELAPDP